MSNWDGVLDTVRSTGKLPTMFAAELSIPMVAPSDLGKVAAARWFIRHVAPKATTRRAAAEAEDGSLMGLSTAAF